MKVAGGLALAAAALTLAAGPATARAADDAPEAAPSPQRMVGFAAGGLGVAGLAGGVVFGLLASASWNSSKSECGSPSACPDRAGAIADHDSAERAAAASTAAFVAGGVLLVGAIVLVVTSPPERARAGALGAPVVRIAPAVSANQAGVAVTATF
jgi:hypothetical protein